MVGLAVGTEVLVGTIVLVGLKVGTALLLGATVGKLEDVIEVGFIEEFGRIVTVD